MCGIFSIFNYNKYNINQILNEFNKSKHRGPDNSKIQVSFISMILGFHRLSINGLNSISDQPITIDNVTLLCNGEIYNYKELYRILDIAPVTDSDCEVIIHLYLRYGIVQTLNMLDGMFSFILFDNKSEYCDKRIYIARDIFGVRPLYRFINDVENCFGFASELKNLHYFYNNKKCGSLIEHFPPAHYAELKLYLINNSYKWIYNKNEDKKYYIIPPPSTVISYNENIIKDMYKNIALKLNSAVIKRCVATDRKIACLLSGGLDSSLVTALVDNYYKLINPNHKIDTYSIGLEGSEDLQYARIVADYLGTNHHEVIVSEYEMFDSIPKVIYDIESYDTTTVRASLGNYLVSEYISKNSDAKVIFNGDGSDELFGGYLYMNRCPDDIEFDKETRRLLENIYFFDVLRSDKCISSNGLEARTPFLDRTFVNYVMSLPIHFKNHNNKGKCEKFLLRNSFTIDIKSEKKYYIDLFNSYYPNCLHIIPHYWMPRYSLQEDPSARTLNLY